MGKAERPLPEQALCDNVVSGGSITGDETGCPSPTWDPGPITNETLPSGGTGDLEYIWMTTTNDPSAPMSQWSPIPNSNSPDYDPGPISVTTYFRRCVRRSGCTNYVGETNIITKEAICCDNVTDGGQITASQVLCSAPYLAMPLSVSVPPTGGSSSLEYQWIASTTGTPYTPGNLDWSPVSGANADTYDPGILIETTYYILLSRRSGCQDYAGVSNMITLEVHSEITAMISGTDETCLGANDGTVSIDGISGGTPGYSLLWTNPPGAVDDTLTGLAPGNYEVIITDDNGCTGSASFFVNNGMPLTVNTVATDVSCAGNSDGTATVSSVSDGMAPYTYIWDDPAFQTLETATGLSAGSYNVVVTDAQGCIGTGTAEVNNAAAMTLTTSTTDANCGGAADGTASVQASGGVFPYQYLWNDPAGQATATATGLLLGDYTVTVTDANGCSATATVSVNAPSQAEVTVSGNDVSCSGAADGSAEAVITGGDPAYYDFIWSNSPPSTANTATGLAPGDYEVTVTDTTGCMVIETISISEPAPLVLTTQAVGAACSNSSDGSATVFVSGGTPFGSGNYLYEWDAPGNPDVQVLDDISPGTYTVTVTDANGCSGEATAEITAPVELLSTLSTTPVSCAGASDGTISSTTSGGTPPYAFLWNDPSASSTSTVTGLAPGNYTLTVTDANGCVEVANATISSPDPLELAFITVDPVCVDDENGSVEAVVTGGTAPYQYSWDNGQTLAILTALASGDYNVTVTDANGCQVTGGTSLSHTSDLALTVSGTDASCFDGNDGTATATASGGTSPFSYIWSNGDISETAASLYAGTYSVTISDADGCSATGNFTVSSPPQLQCNITLISPVTTNNGNQGSLAADAAGGAGSFTYNWSNGSQQQTASNLQPGIHTVTVTDANNCQCTAQYSLINPSKIGNFVWNDLNQNGLQDLNEPGIANHEVRLTGTANGGTPVSLITYTNASGIYAFDGLTAGFYQVTFDDLPNHAFTFQDAGNNNLDSDADPATGTTQQFALAQGSFDSRWDCGLVVLDEKINIGDYVWYDVNHNGIQDVGESGVNNVTVKLLDFPSNAVLSVTQTDQSGKYLFEDVMPGQYLIEFTQTSFPAGGYVLAQKDAGTNDNLDSDANSSTGLTDPFTVFAFTLDDMSLDAGIFKECDNLTSGGVIGDDEDLCGIGADPAEIVNIVSPSGGYGTIEYLWLYSSIPVYNGPGDPNWYAIPNSNSPNYDPGPISASTYYIRCARRAGCNDYIAESNIVSKNITAYPLAAIVDEPGVLCMNSGGRFEAAIAGAGASYYWEFGTDATPQTATTRVVDPVMWSAQGLKDVTLTVTRFGCSFPASTTVTVEDCGNQPIIVINGLNAELEHDAVKLEWQAGGDMEDVIFFIQRSENGLDYQNISGMAGIPSASMRTYTYTDQEPELGENIYRVMYRKMDDESVRGYSETALVNYHPEGMGHAVVYPNPARDHVTVELLEPVDKVTVCEVSSLLGKVLASYELPPQSDKLEIDLSAYPGGIYLIKIKQHRKRAVIKRIFKTE